MSYFNKATLANFNTYLESIGTLPHMAEALVKLIETSPNPEVAHEMLSGVYEQPNLARETKLGTLVSFDPFKERVTYLWVKEETLYFKHQRSADEFTNLGVISSGGNPVETPGYPIPAKGIVKGTDWCFITEWQSATIADEPNEGLMAPDCERCYQGYEDCPCQDKTE